MAFALFCVITVLVVGATLYGLYWVVREMFGDGEFLLGSFIGALLLVMLLLEILGALAIYDSAFVYHETFTLRTDQWSCSDNETSVQMVPMASVGPNGTATTILMPQTVTECVEYRKR